MENKNTLSFTFIIVAIILGVTLFKEFNFETLSFGKPLLAIVYMITFAFSVYFIIKKYRSGSEK